MGAICNAAVESRGPMARNPELEAQIRANPDDEQLRLVYADWLLSEGDPRGELIALQQRADELDPKSDEHERLIEEIESIIDRHQLEIFGDAASVREMLSVRWELGLIRTIALRMPEGVRDIDAVVRAVVEAPAAACLQRLVVAHDGDANLQPAVDVIVTSDLGVRDLHLGAQFQNVKVGFNLIRQEQPRRRTLREIMFGRRRRTEPDPIVDDVTGLCRLSQLEELQIVGHRVELGGPLQSEALRVLALRQDVRPHAIEDVARSTLPALSRLVVNVRQASTGDILALLQADFPRLSELTLRSVVEPTDVLTELSGLIAGRAMKSVTVTILGRVDQQLVEQVRKSVAPTRLRVRWE